MNYLPFTTGVAENGFSTVHRLVCHILDVQLRYQSLHTCLQFAIRKPELEVDPTTRESVINDAANKFITELDVETGLSKRRIQLDMGSGNSDIGGKQNFSEQPS